MTEVGRVIEVVPYENRWKTEFENIKNMINSYIGDLVVTIEHVGSTSVEGLSAKPIIDINVLMDNYKVFPRIIERLEREGFIYEGDLGVKGRETFKRTFVDEHMKYYLYVCPKDGREHQRQIAFRDYLRENPDAKEAYGLLKVNLAKEYRHDIGNYTRHKKDFVEDIILKSGHNALSSLISFKQGK